MWKLVPVFGWLLALVASSGHAFAATDHYVRGYTSRSGTFVMPHRQTNPNGTKLDNWSTTGNVNPYNGTRGTRRP
jgi:hypothetical protein